MDTVTKGFVQDFKAKSVNRMAIKNAKGFTN